MKPEIEPPIDLTSYVDRISPKKKRVVMLFRLFSAIQQLHQPSNAALEQAYLLYQRDHHLLLDFDNPAYSQSSSQAFKDCLREVGATNLLDALQEWVKAMNLEKWSHRRGQPLDAEPLEVAALPLGFEVLRARWSLESQGQRTDFPAIYDLLQILTVFQFPECDLPSLNCDSNRLLLPLYDPTTMTVEHFRAACDVLIERHTRQIDYEYENFGYEVAGFGKKSDDQAVWRRKTGQRTLPSRRPETDQSRLARAVWDVLTADTIERAASVAAEYGYLIDADTLRHAVHEVAGAIFHPEKESKVYFENGKMYVRNLDQILRQTSGS